MFMMLTFAAGGILLMATAQGWGQVIMGGTILGLCILMGLSRYRRG
ncbi:hypothetical protein ACJ4V0_15980 [Phreatobacter sp. HK31-P]